MSRIELAPEVGEDLDRIFDHLAQYDVADAHGHIQDIIQAISVLEHNPLIGRPVMDDMRELVIGRCTRGYVALYRYIAEMDAVFVLALRSQREAGYAGS
ncbi:MAG: type II toxin-antitoxin system RelE/ParE family toxin [Collimonas pratensis]|uniref:type II toxin-antitoxin system RelE/ParE family toxin n=1 Tax=Collimonas pratensis TaxID=279113 RepID=UPI003C7884A2